MSEPNEEVRRYLQFAAVVRIGYGALAFLTPRFGASVLGFKYSDDARGLNYFLGSRDIAIGLHSLMVANTERQLDGVTVNHACEVFDTILVTQELRAGRRGIFAAIMVPFNASQHVIWTRARQLLSR